MLIEDTHYNVSGFTVETDNILPLDSSVAEKVFNKLIAYQLAIIDDLPCKAETLMSEAIVILSTKCHKESVDNLDATRAEILNNARQIVEASTYVVNFLEQQTEIHT